MEKVNQIPDHPSTDHRTLAVDEETFVLFVEQLDDDYEMRDEIVGTYLEEGDRQTASLTAAAHAGRGAEVAAIAHSLRSTSALLGADPLRDLLLQIEEAARTPPDSCVPLARLIEAEYARVKTTLTRLTHPAAAESD